MASQTLENISWIDDVAGMPVFRPLIGTDKLEITAEAQRLGTFEISIEPDADCCTLFTPQHSATRMSAEAVSAMEVAIDVAWLLEMGTSPAILATFEFPSVSGADEPDSPYRMGYWLTKGRPNGTGPLRKARSSHHRRG